MFKQFLFSSFLFALSNFSIADDKTQIQPVSEDKALIEVQSASDTQNQSVSDDKPLTQTPSTSDGKTVTQIKPVLTATSVNNGSVNATTEIRIDKIGDVFNTVPKNIQLVSQEDLNTYKKPILSELNQTRSNYSIYSVESDGRLMYMNATASRRNRSYVVVSDYMQYANRSVDGKSERVGYMIRIRANINSSSNGTDISGIFPLGVAVKNNKISGSLAVEVHGLSGPDISKYIGSPFSLSEESLIKSVETAAILRSRIYDDGINVRPVVIPAGSN